MGQHCARLAILCLCLIEPAAALSRETDCGAGRWCKVFVMEVGLLSRPMTMDFAPDNRSRSRERDREVYLQAMASRAQRIMLVMLW